MLKKNNDADPAIEPDRLSPAMFLKVRDKWINQVNASAELSHAAARVGTFIALRMNAHNQRSNWPVKKIAPMVNCSTATVSAAIAQLVSARFLVVHRPNRRANQTYFIRLPYGL